MKINPQVSLERGRKLADKLIVNPKSLTLEEHRTLTIDTLVNSMFMLYTMNDEGDGTTLACAMLAATLSAIDENWIDELLGSGVKLFKKHCPSADTYLHEDKYIFIDPGTDGGSHQTVKNLERNKDKIIRERRMRLPHIQGVLISAAALAQTSHALTEDSFLLSVSSTLSFVHIGLGDGWLPEFVYESFKFMKEKHPEDIKVSEADWQAKKRTKPKKTRWIDVKNQSRFQRFT